MVRHVILWQLQDGLSASEKESVKAAIKSGLEGLKDKVDGVSEITVFTQPLASSNTDIMLDAYFADAAALERYAAFPEHIQIAGTIIKPNVKSRICMDFEVEQSAGNGIAS